MDLEVKLFNPRRVICEAVKITKENYQQVRLWVVRRGDSGFARRPSATGSSGVVTAGSSS